jgi:hypothetical protein
LDIGLEDLLYSWTGDEFAVFGLEGRPKPVFMVEISNEKKRKEVFDKLFDSFAVSEDTKVVLDGIRIPQITIPGFLEKVLGLFKVSVPSPYYAVEDGYLFLSEAPENISSVLSSLRKNDSILRTNTWKSLSAGGSARSSLGVFYSLDRTLPFFLKGQSGVHRILQLYRQGLLRLQIEGGSSAGRITISLSAIAGSGKGLLSIPGFPLEAGGRVSREVYALRYTKKGEARIAFVVDGGTVLSVDPSTGSKRELTSTSSIYLTPVFGKSPSEPEDPSFWCVDEEGTVYLLDGDLEILPGFPVSTAMKPAAASTALSLSGGDTLCFPSMEQSLVLVNAKGEVSTLPLPFTGQLRSAPTILNTGKNALFGMYPKSFFGQIWITDEAGSPRAGWPVDVSGIAFGSPLLFTQGSAIRAAFLTQAGLLAVYDNSGEVLPGFPLQLPGVFYMQPVFDGTNLWALSSEGVLYRVDLNGSMFYQEIPGFRAEEGSLACADIDRDGSPEVFITGEGNALYGYTKNFTLLGGFPLPVWGSPYFGDINGDGRVECIGSGLDNKIYGWQFK